VTPPVAPIATNLSTGRGGRLARAHIPAHAVAHAPRMDLGSQHRRRADAAAPTPVMASRDGHRPGLAPHRAQQPRSFPEVTPVLAVRPGVVEAAAGEVIPRRRPSPRHFVKHLASLLKTRP
jgi:hypothetical protein